MKRFKYTGLIILFAISALKAQVVISVPALSGSMIKPDMLWNLIVVNQGQVFDGMIQLTVNDRNNKIIFNAGSSVISFPRGAKTIFYNSVVPVNMIYNTIGTNNDWIKVGKYFVCYTVMSSNHGKTPLAQECTELNIEPLSPPMLNEPSDKSIVYETRPNFLWLQPTPPQLFRGLKYEIKLAELQKGQSALEAIKNNSPVYFENNLNQTSKLLPSSYKALEINHHYVWQITAYDLADYSIKSEYWQFTIAKDSVKEIIDNSPYIHLSLNKADMGMMHQGYIKIVLNNYSADTTANLCLREEGAMDECIVNVPVSILPGENYILKQIAGRVKLDEKKIYQIIWINSRNEKWIVRYQPKYYR